MVWKPKEKELTPEEAIALAKKELAPRWIRTEPMFAVLSSEKEKKLQIYPLGTEFLSKKWLCFFVDPTCYPDRALVGVCREFLRRYSFKGIHPLFIFPPRFEFLREPERLARWMRTWKLEAPVLLDLDRTLVQAFGYTQSPTVALLEQGVPVAVGEGLSEVLQFEVILQQFLRRTDPGLALLPPMALEPLVEKQRFSFDFREHPNVIREVVDGFSLSGNASLEGDHLLIQDPNFQASLKLQTDRLGLVLEGVKDNEAARLVIQGAGIPIYETFLGEDLRVEDDGKTGAPFLEARLYRLTVGLPEKFREITIQFPHADRLPVRWYGIRFGEKL